MKSLLLIGLSFLLLNNCTTKPKEVGRLSDIGVWEGKVQLIQGPSKKWANVNWVSDSENNRMRVDVSAVFDIPLATFILNEEGYQLWVFKEKTHYRSDRGERIFEHLTRLRFPPRLFFSFLGRPQHPGGDWVCEKTKEPIFRCSTPSKKLRYSVDYSQSSQRVIKVKDTGRRIKLRLSRSKVQVRDKMFKSLKSSHFKTIIL